VAGNHNIKVADFGLAKDIYTSEYYRSEQGGALPVKWMSPESLLDNYFDEKTDVVCAIPGVVLEIFKGGFHSMKTGWRDFFSSLAFSVTPYCLLRHSFTKSRIYLLG